MDATREKHISEMICQREEYLNARGNLVKTGFMLNYDRYAFDFEHCTKEKGWNQYDTDQDASYFGVWVNIKERKILTFAEGDLQLTYCETAGKLKEELAAMAVFYGSPPPAFTVISNNGSITKVYDERPTA